MKLIPKFFLVLSICISTVASADWATQQEYWYGVAIDGAKSGWAHETVEIESESGI